jgi:sphingomyelin phosphodiesterase acid-like 3
LLGALAGIQAVAGGAAPKQAEHTVAALMVSDIHFDPFHDPGQAQQLATTPIKGWNLILSGAASQDPEAAWGKLQQSCRERGLDSSYAVFRSSLDAMHSHQADAKFITVSGDLIAHSFSCKYAAIFPSAKPGEYEAFVEKTIGFVMLELRAAFPNLPVYAALGNNDTDCGDYQLDAGSDFLAQTGKIFAEALPAGERERVAKEFAAGGYYSVTMAAPMHETRLIVVNDLFLSPKYTTCGHKPDHAAADAQMAWLKAQLDEVRRLHQKAWVMGHIPPGVDPYSTVAKFKNVCGGQAPAMFLASDKLADLLMEYSDVVRLGIFAHTHMDEVHLLRADGSAGGTPVLLKLIPSISPVDGNNPAFTVARVEPQTGSLTDYEVIAASNQTGVDTKWSREYLFSEAYQQPEFSLPVVESLIAGFASDRNADSPLSKTYIRDYFVGDMSAELKPFWRQYVCSMANPTAKGYAACLCPAPAATK